ncbi:DpnI domain-containing protein [uncultured Mailhella sp.]|uniref:DpnI domain-containing protein n=1 Tax=uncultured Mailhella sp. TaxID=1981031 RepID=UPI00262008D9|nr:DpnI domain-containing protein [uncultured Mailhella sp.]
MDLKFNIKLGEKYRSSSQKARVLTESWVENNLFCPRCGHNKICHFSNNRPVADFYCPNCKSQYELKSKHGTLGTKIADGAYRTMIERITGNENPDFLVMSYSLSDMSVTNLVFIPKFFFLPDIIEKRPPLPPTARRAGWIGCNLLIDRIPQQGRISIISDGLEQNQKHILERVNASQKLNTYNILYRSWMMDILNCINAIPKYYFELSELYAFENILAEKHQNNHNIRPKIRQQLQLLRDKGIVEFIEKGKYRKL